jgi:hypothetical protein
MRNFIKQFLIGSSIGAFVTYLIMTFELFVYTSG